MCSERTGVNGNFTRNVLIAVFFLEDEAKAD